VVCRMLTGWIGYMMCSRLIYESGPGIDTSNVQSTRCKARQSNTLLPDYGMHSTAAINHLWCYN
jgi:hypothetical protein